ncbi:hypothetical protein R3P38DRAFT_3231991 [Favolaschia claudopus]|uniref:Gag-like protein n=1 Tax=Favolaschia claudopus TaxID=2862362 RepID=A0AAV9ZJB8_9AGAR
MTDSELEEGETSEAECEDSEEKVLRMVNELMAELRKHSDHRPWSEMLVGKIRGITFKFDRELFAVRAESTSEGKTTEADPFLSQNDPVTKLARAVDILSKQVTTIQRTIEGPFKASEGQVRSSQPISSNPKDSVAAGPVYKPTKNAKATPPPTNQIQKPKNQLSPYHHSRLIVNLSNVPLGAERDPERDIAKRINERLRGHTPIVVTAVKYNAKSNCIIFTREDQTAEELQKHEHLFLDIVAYAYGGQATTRLDTPWHKIQIHGVWTGISAGRLLEGKGVWEELCAMNAEIAKMALQHEPRWMRPSEDLTRELRDTSSVIIALRNEDDAKHLVKKGPVNAFGGFCDVKKHSETPPTQQCNKCWGFGHTKLRCKSTVRCRLCAENHDEKDHAGKRSQTGPNEGDTVMADIIEPKCAICPERTRYVGVVREREETGGKTKGRAKLKGTAATWTEVNRGKGAQQNNGDPPNQPSTTNQFGALSVEGADPDFIQSLKNNSPNMTIEDIRRQPLLSAVLSVEHQYTVFRALVAEVNLRQATFGYLGLRRSRASPTPGRRNFAYIYLRYTSSFLIFLNYSSQLGELNS